MSTIHLVKQWAEAEALLKALQWKLTELQRDCPPDFEPMATKIRQMRSLTYADNVVVSSGSDSTFWDFDKTLDASLFKLINQHDK